ncbi:substrate-binding domain-containing protein [Rhizobium paknamense]|uniref:Ribose transport system substrate-binding protein/inositol transport system substrate-binding protein n=1 Tax=Rhizobium paknamense TaxID=1206817 RepID=A0ABU0IDA5_9HYPH|nr:substrate-binding domain-containing protein [Rhizobium paknamense]MDQ0455214.1 ribose transport system substrate-binding protein/inositol transport system substrate-binding protein [Rhizobium paknamense]
MRSLIAVSVMLSLSAAPAWSKTLAFAIANASDTFQSGLLKAVEDAAKQSGQTLTVSDAKADPAKQMEQIKAIIAAKPDAAILALIDSDMGAEVSKMATAANVPVVYVNNTPSNVEDLPPKETLVASQEQEAGTLQGKEVCRLMNGKGKAVILTGPLYHEAARTRTAVVEKIFSEAPCNGIEVVEHQSADWETDLADQQTEEWLKAGVQFDGVIANNDSMALGAIAALKRHNVDMKKVVVAGIDATADGKKAMMAGDLDVTVLQDAAGLGKASVEAAIKLASGETVAQRITVPFKLVTPANIDQFVAKTQ